MLAQAKRRGLQVPPIRVVPADVVTTQTADDTAALAAHAGMPLDPWQRLVLTDAMGERAGGRWAATEVGVTVGRQNGKGGIIEARQLAGLFLLRERLQIYTAHEFKTAVEMFERIVSLIEDCPDLKAELAVNGIKKANGEQGIKLRTGERLRFLARSGGSGRGFSGDTVYLDEDMFLVPQQIGALMPTLSARPNPQVWYLGSAGWRISVVQARLFRRALAALAAPGSHPRLAYADWNPRLSLDEVRQLLADRDLWAATNPTYGDRITEEDVLRELDSLSEEEFIRERLSIPDYPPEDDAEAWQVIARETWEALADPAARARAEGRRVDPEGTVMFAADVTPDRGWGSIAVAGIRDGLQRIENVDHRRGTNWMVDRLVDLVEDWDCAGVVIDEKGPAGSLVTALRAADVEVIIPTTAEVGQACAQFFDAAVVKPPDLPTLRHLDQSPLNDALAGAAKRPLGDAWAWNRRTPGVVISPLVAATLALWGYTTHVRLDGPVDQWDTFG